MGKIKIGGQFSGVGAFDFALKSLGIDFLNVYQAEWDKYARQSYLANHDAPEYYIQDVNDTPTQKITEKHGSLDLVMFSPPCQSFSLAGQRGGKDDLKGRGVLFFNSLEFISINKPRFFIFENVKGLLSADGGVTFGEWVRLLGGKSVNNSHVLFPDDDSVPYHIYYKVLNAKQYGVPQNRERVFIVGIRDDIDNVFSWPKETKLIKRLKDVLETEVDEKYYLSEKTINYINKRIGIYTDLNPDISRTLLSQYSQSANGSFIKDDTPKVIHQLKGGKWDKMHEQSRRVYDVEAIAPTIHTMGGGNQEPKILQKSRGYNQGGEHEICPSITSNAWQENNHLQADRIRKLTPLECFRLMGFPDSFVQKARSVKISDSQLYKQAGNSIVVDVLSAIISKLKIN